MSPRYLSARSFWRWSTRVAGGRRKASSSRGAAKGTRREPDAAGCQQAPSSRSAAGATRTTSGESLAGNCSPDTLAPLPVPPASAESHEQEPFSDEAVRARFAAGEPLEEELAVALCWCRPSASGVLGCACACACVLAGAAGTGLPGTTTAAAALEPASEAAAAASFSTAVGKRQALALE